MAIDKGQLNSKWIYEVIVSPKMLTKNYKDFCPTKQTRIIAKKKCYDPCLYSKTEIHVIFGMHFGINNDLVNSTDVYAFTEKLIQRKEHLFYKKCLFGTF